MDIYKPSVEDLQSLIDEATEKQTPEQHAEKYLATVARILTKNPERYLAYGPFWWLLKKELIQGGYLDFGDNLDAEAIDSTDYGNTTHNLVAIWAYSQSQFEMGTIQSHEHTLHDSNGEPYRYVLEDRDMELLSVAASAVKGA